MLLSTACWGTCEIYTASHPTNVPEPSAFRLTVSLRICYEDGHSQHLEDPELAAMDAQRLVAVQVAMTRQAKRWSPVIPGQHSHEHSAPVKSKTDASNLFLVRVKPLHPPVRAT